LAASLRAECPPEWEVVVHEWVLRAPWGTTDQRVRQLRRVLAVARLPRVHVRVLPIDAGPVRGLGGAFAVLEYSSYDPVVYRDDGEVGHFAEDTEDTDRHTVLATSSARWR
jgi:hypothetical protein